MIVIYFSQLSTDKQTVSNVMRFHANKINLLALDLLEGNCASPSYNFGGGVEGLSENLFDRYFSNWKGLK